MATRIAQDSVYQDVELQDALVDAFSVPEVSDFMQELQEELEYTVANAIDTQVSSWVNQVWPRIVRVIVQNLSEGFIVSDESMRSMEQLGIGMGEVILDNLKNEVTEVLNENAPVYGVQDALNKLETEFLRIAKGGQK